MRTQEHVHLQLIPGLSAVVGAPYSVSLMPTAETMAQTFTTMYMGDFFGRMGGVVDNIVGSVDSINHRRIRVDRDTLLGALDDPVGIICSRWQEARSHRRRLEEHTIALRASLLERLGLLSAPGGRPTVSVPTVTVGEAFGNHRDIAVETLIGAFWERNRAYTPSQVPTRMHESLSSVMSQRVPADLLAGYWHRYREHFLVAQMTDPAIIGFIMTGGLNGLLFGPVESIERYLREPSIATTGQGVISAEILSNGSISTSNVSYADVLASVFAQRTDDRMMAGAPVQPPPDKKYTAKHAKLSVLLRPTRTVFGIPVQVESDGSEIFVKPRTEGGK